jgi:hypothetical protein
MTGHLTALTGYLTGCSKKNPMFMRVLTGLRVFTPKWGGCPIFPRTSVPRLSTAIRAFPRQTFNRTENEMRPVITLAPVPMFPRDHNLDLLRL